MGGETDLGRPPDAGLRVVHPSTPNADRDSGPEASAVRDAGEVVMVEGGETGLGGPPDAGLRVVHPSRPNADKSSGPE